VQLVAFTTEGCRSDTVTSLLPVRYRPDAVFGWSHPLCENEIVRFNNTSFMPAAASPDFIARWYWQFDNIPASGSQNPGYNFGPGPHQASLVAESNYGCKSASADSQLVINARPGITVDINDSCVLRNINFRAVDQSHTVDKWYWDFGNGLYRGSTLATQSFLAEGYFPFTLIGQTVEGCRDTLLRPFTIYDNKALAGRDTIAAMNEPVQLSANAGRPAQYSWSPSTGLNDANIANPVATLDKNQLYSLESITDKGCVSHSKILITRYKGPQLYIPNAFTPNGDGNNDVLKVFPVGIKTFTSFAVFNRYGQQLFYSTDRNRGWDGRYGGKVQEPGTYVVMAQAVDYRGQIMLQKQTVILIR
jgi:gliding motility-associated-like protein